MKINRIVFFGTPEFAVPCLEILTQHQKNVTLVVTQPDKPAGRGKKMTSPPIKIFCDENNIPCIQPKTIKSEKFLKQMKELKADLFVVVAFGRIFPNALLDVAPLSLNVHASLLPRWRGASPISQSILHRDVETGVSIMKVVEELDAGPVMLKKSILIEEDDDTEILTTKLSLLGSKTLLESIEMLERDEAKFVEQDDKHATFAPILEVEDARIDWNRTAEEIQHHIRAYAPSPGAHTFDGVERIKIYKSRVILDGPIGKPGTVTREKKRLKVDCVDGSLDLIELQRPGKKKQGVIDFLNGYPLERKLWS